MTCAGISSDCFASIIIPMRMFAMTLLEHTTTTSAKIAGTLGLWVICNMRKHIPNGARVHHSNQLWTYGWNEAQRKANPQWGWGTVISSVPQHDGSFEYEVMPDAPILKSQELKPTWWPSWLIDEAW